MSGQVPLFEAGQEQATSDDYYTPAWLFERMAIRFDLDVASPPGGVPWVPADRFYTMADDGLSAPWEGRVWMNPPYSKPEPWVTKFIEHRNGICLVPMSNGEWFWRLWGASDGVTLAAPKALKFIGGGIPIRTALAAFGAECVDAIGRIGRVR